MEEIQNKVNAILEKVRPYVQMHGGDVRLIALKDGTATLKIDGTCVHCSLAQLTYNKNIGPLLKQEVPEIIEVIFE